MPDSLSLQQVRRVARLACLDLSDEQLEEHRGRLSAVLEYFDRLRELDLDDVEPMTHPVTSTNRLAADEPGPTLPIDALLKNAPAVEGRFLAVPKVLEEGGGA